MRSIRVFAQHLRLQIHRLVYNQRGIAAVEFAMLLPLMVTLYLGTAEVSQGISIDRKVTLTVRTIADLVSQVSSIDTAGMADVFNASSSVMVPYSTSPLKITVSGVNIDASNKATIAWSCTLKGTARSVGSTVTLPTSLNIANTSLIWSEAQYAFKPAVGYIITGTMTLKDQLYMAPRLSNSVTGPSSC